MIDGKPESRASSGRRILALVVVLVITSLVATGFVWAHKKVQIQADGKNIEVSTLYGTPEQVLAQAGVKLGPSDEYRLSTTKLVNGSTIEVFRAVAVSIAYQDKNIDLVTGKPTVGELVQSLGIDLNTSKVSPDPSVRIQPGMRIQVVRLSEKTVQEEMPVAFSAVRQPDPNLEAGTEKMAQEGQDGVKLATVRLHFEDGEQTSSEVVSETVITPPQPQIILVGTRDTVQTSRGAVRFRSVEWMEATAYHPQDGSGTGLTASGIPARHGIVAVDPQVIALGTRLFIPGYGLALAADTGGDIVGNRIDLCMEDYSDAWRFGRRTVKVYILAE